ncbi:helix-turn-helix domain-containing protein [Aerococcaceae bacterium DSM 109653]|uniref:Helix-turn-helix domain-containing protein n=1 Tax=Fundicoccus ignavus TaxID=2664442 RepID=A0A844BVI8_9LACT|nr:helix-turn-helix domain-containing protein [Fundicoccus ignavus]
MLKQTHVKKRLSYQERCQLAVLKKEAYSHRAIAKLLNRSPQTIHNKTRRGIIAQIRRQKQKSKIYEHPYTIYDADAGQVNYEHQHLNSGRRAKRAPTMRLLTGQTIKCFNTNGRLMLS